MYDFSPIISRKLIWYKPLQEYTTSDTSFSTFLPNLWKTVIFIGTKKWQTYTTIVVHQQQNNVIFPRDGIMCSHSQENNSASFYRRISFLSFTLLLTKISHGAGTSAAGGWFWPWIHRRLEVKSSSVRSRTAAVLRRFSGLHWEQGSLKTWSCCFCAPATGCPIFRSVLGKRI